MINNQLEQVVLSNKKKQEHSYKHGWNILERLEGTNRHLQWPGFTFNIAIQLLVSIANFVENMWSEYNIKEKVWSHVVLLTGSFTRWTQNSIGSDVITKK